MATNFRKVIDQAYREILGRPADQGGSDSYNSAMNGGMTEAAMRESLLRSPEYATNNPEGGTVPPPSGITPLRVVGNKFHNSAGEVKLLGYIICCDDPLTPEDEAVSMGWPLVNTLALDAMKAHKLNYTDIRLGPSIDRTVFGDGESPDSDGYLLVGPQGQGLYDLDQWNPRFWARVRKSLEDAAARGIYVCVSVIDSWVLHHEFTPWSATRNIQGYEGGSLAVVKHAPSPRHEAWIRKVVRETCAFHNVLYLDGNESFKGQPDLSWLHGIRDIARSEMGANRRVFGSNSDRTDAVDYLVSHHGTVPPVGSKPHLDTEYQPSPTIDRILSNAKAGWDTGSASFHYWAGEHSLAQRAEVLAGLKDIVEGGGSVLPVPSTCPWLVRMGTKVHNVMDGGFQTLVPPIPVPGGFVVIDLTPRFSNNPNDPQGKPCNNEHNVVCGGRECEDPRGGHWTLVAGNAAMKIQEHGFQVRIGPLGTGSYTVRCAPWPDYKDGEEGKPVRVGPNATRELTFTVGVPTGAQEA